MYIVKLITIIIIIYTHIFKCKIYTLHIIFNCFITIHTQLKNPIMHTFKFIIGKYHNLKYPDFILTNIYLIYEIFIFLNTKK